MTRLESMMRFFVPKAPKGHQRCVVRRSDSSDGAPSVVYECECKLQVPARPDLDVHFAAVRS